jgi:folylpolyglutamate synthase/dihydropteroate synthase
MKDKNSTEMVDIITSGLDNCEFLAVSIEYGRAEETEVLARMISGSGRECKACRSTAEAFETAMNSGADSVLAAGSIYLAGDMRTLYKIHQKHV